MILSVSLLGEQTKIKMPRVSRLFPQFNTRADQIYAVPAIVKASYQIGPTTKPARS
jgi:hypothetical protein